MSIKKLITAGIAAAAAASVALTAGAVGLGYSDKDVEFYMSGDEEVVVSAQVNFPGTDMEDQGGPVFEARIPAGALEEGAYTFRVVALDEEGDRKKANDALHFYYSYMGMSTTSLEEMYAFDLSFLDENGASVSPGNVKILMKMIYTGALYDVFIEESDGTLTRLDHYEDDEGISFIPPHFSKFFVVSYHEEPIAPPPDYDSEPEIIPVTDDTNKDPVDGGKSEPTSEPTSEPASETSDTSAPLPKPDDKGANTGDSGSAVAVAAGIIAFAALGTALVASKSKKASK